MPLDVKEAIALRCTIPPSNKDYNVQLVGPNPEGLYDVQFQYGAHGSTLRPGSKTKGFVPYDKAKKAYDKIVKEQLQGGYVVSGAAAASYQSPVTEKQPFGQFPQLLNPISDERLEELLNDNTTIMQEKKDGRRTMVKLAGGQVTGGNKKGELIALPEPIVSFMQTIPRDIQFDGEAIGNTLFCFDLLQVGAADLRNHPYYRRLEALEMIFKAHNLAPALRLVRTARTSADKRLLFNQLRQEKAEGVVFKDPDAFYTAGRPNSNGPQTKWKFVSSATVQVTSHVDGKNSIRMSCRRAEDDMPIDVGKCTIPETTPMPPLGALVEMRYLYCHVNGKLFQSVYLGPRDDQDKADTYESLKFKQPVEGDDDV